MRAALAFVAIAACSRAPHAPPAMADLSASLDAARAEFDAHAGEARFLALLSPT